jgi:hypothetical protein
MIANVDFSSQAYFRNQAGRIEELRATGPIVQFTYPITPA